MPIPDGQAATTEPRASISFGIYEKRCCRLAVVIIMAIKGEPCFFVVVYSECFPSSTVENNGTLLVIEIRTYIYTINTKKIISFLIVYDIINHKKQILKEMGRRT